MMRKPRSPRSAPALVKYRFMIPGTEQTRDSKQMFELAQSEHSKLIAMVEQETGKKGVELLGCITSIDYFPQPILEPVEVNDEG